MDPPVRADGRARPTLAHDAVPLAQLRERHEGATLAFAQQMRDRGIAVLRVGAAEMAVFDECNVAANTFFADTPAATKHEGKMSADGERDW